MTHRPATVAPGAGDTATRASRQVPEASSASAVFRAVSSSGTRNAVVGPEPETRAARAPAAVPAASVSAREGRRESAAGWRSLPRAAASASGSPERRAASRAGDAAGWGPRYRR
ncbi:hypothetical protein SCALM49S_09758 [Streptomyces californicus]